MILVLVKPSAVKTKKGKWYKKRTLVYNQIILIVAGKSRI